MGEANFSAEALVLRPARPSDRDGMLRITENVWDGTDYVPFVWKRWLEDPYGYLSVATWNDRLVGLQHVSVQGARCAWLEGIRVDEEMWGHGIGAAMLRHGLAWARGAGYSVARLSTSSGNEASGHIALRAGLHELGRFHVLTGVPNLVERAPTGTVRLAHSGDLRMLQGVLVERPRAAGTVPMYTEGWTAYELTPERLHLLVAAHAVVIAEDQDAPAVGIATVSPGRPYLRLGYLRGSEAGMAAVTTWMQAQVCVAGLKSVRAVVRSDPSVRSVLESLGYSSTAGFSMILWETAL